MIHKILILCFFILSGFIIQAQMKFTSYKGEMNFTSDAKLEVIKASSNKIQGIIDPSNGHFAFLIKIKSFEGFNSELQREHFNEKYMESEKYYDATFTGTILEPIDFTKDGSYDIQVKGNLIVHGKKQDRIIPATIKISKGTLTIDCTFSVKLADHDIKIPSVLYEKIATEIFVKLNILMVQK